jgi:hypothetical protein
MNATGRTALRSVAALVAGASAGLVAWLVLVPWDLSEIDESGVVIQGGGDDNAGNIAAVAIVLLAVGLVLAFLQRTRTSAAAFTLGGYVTWAVLFGWRVGSARVSGANFFIIPLVIVVIPAAVIVPLVVRSVARQQRRRSVRNE